MRSPHWTAEARRLAEAAGNRIPNAKDRDLGLNRGARIDHAEALE
jgi:hypothetical protein